MPSSNGRAHRTSTMQTGPGSRFAKRLSTTAGLVIVAAALLLVAAPQLGTAALAQNPSPFLVTRSGSTYTAASQTTTTAYAGTLKNVVESAVQDLNAFPEGGVITFSAGTFDLGSDFFVLHDVHDIVFEGQGMDQTVIENVNDAAQDTEPFNFSTATRITIRNLTVSAGGAPRTTSDAIDFDNGSHSLIDHVKITSSRSRGIIFDGKGDAGQGISWAADFNVVSNCVISGTQSAAGDGIELLASNDNEIYGCTITNVVNNGINVAKASTLAFSPNKKSNDNYIHDNTIEAAGRNGILVNSSDGNRIENNTARNNGQAVTADGIRLESNDSVNCDANRVSGNLSTDTQAIGTQQYGLNIADPLCNGTVVGANNLDGNVKDPIHDLGTNTQYLTDTLPFFDGFESGDLSRWTHDNGLVAEQAQAFAGAWAAEGLTTGAGGASATKQLSPTKTDVYYMLHFRVGSRAASTPLNLLRFRNAAAAANPIATLSVSATARIQLRNDVTGTLSLSSTVAQDGSWHTAEVHILVNGTNSQTEVWVDGAPVPELSQSGVDLGTTPIGRLELGDPATTKTYDVFYDDVKASGTFIPTDYTAPSPPGNLRATNVTADEVDLAWDAATDDTGVTGYRVYRDGAQVGEVDGSTLAYGDTTVAASTQYTYRVTALDAIGNESAPSDPVMVTTPAHPDTTSPSPPTTVTAAAVSHTEIDLGWSGAADNVGVTGYQIFRDGALIASVGGSPTNYADTGLAPDTTYAYTIRAVDAAGNVSVDSTPASAKTPVFLDGFETGNFSKWTSATALVAQQSNVYGGSWAAEAKSNKSTVAYAMKQLPTTYTDLYYRLRLKILAGKPDTVDVLRFRTASGGNLLALFYDPKRKLGYRNEVGSTTTTSATTLVVGTWYELKVHLVVNGTGSQVEVWLNGSKIAALSKTDSVGTNPIGQVVAGESVTGHAYDYALDDVRVDSVP